MSIPRLSNKSETSSFNLSSTRICNIDVTGKFGADMQVSLTNDGPFTIMLE